MPIVDMPVRELEAYMGSSPRPRDFDEYWARALAALDAQGSAVLLARYADPGYATVYKVTDGVLTKLFGHAPALYEPPCTQFLTKKGDVVNAPLIKALGKDRGPRCK